MAENALELTRTPRAEVPAAETPKPEALFGLATGVVVVSALYLAREVLIPITLAVFLTFFLAPIVKLLQRARLPKVAAVAVSVALALAVILSVAGLIGAQLKSLVADAPQYQTTVINKFETLHNTMNGFAKQVTGRLGPVYKAPARAPGAPGDAEPDQPPIPVIVQSSSSGYLETAKLILEPILSPLSTLAIVLIVTISFSCGRRIFGIGLSGCLAPTIFIGPPSRWTTPHNASPGISSLRPQSTQASGY
jgi:predicted PurR-regulated permease PerM